MSKTAKYLLFFALVVCFELVAKIYGFGITNVYLLMFCLRSGIITMFIAEVEAKDESEI